MNIMPLPKIPSLNGLPLQSSPLPPPPSTSAGHAIAAASHLAKGMRSDEVGESERIDAAAEALKAAATLPLDAAALEYRVIGSAFDFAAGEFVGTFAGDAAAAGADVLRGASTTASTINRTTVDPAVTTAVDSVTPAVKWDRGAARIGVGFAAVLPIVVEAVSPSAVIDLIQLGGAAKQSNGSGPTERKHDGDTAEFAEINHACYDGEDRTKDGWVRDVHAEEKMGMPLSDPDTGLEAKVYQKDGVSVLVFEGSQDDTDWGVDYAQGLGVVPKQYRQALWIAIKFKEVYGKEGDVVVTGHSLGGGVAEFAGLGAGIETHTFNPAGLGWGARMFLKVNGWLDRNEPLVQSTVTKGEVIDDLRLHQNFSPLTAVIGDVDRIDRESKNPFEAHGNY